MRLIPALVLSAALPLAAVAQSLQNAQFRLDYSPTGITSLKHVHDKYDTDYIAASRTVGDLLIRYRAAGEKDWEQASAAVLNTSSPANAQEVSFTIGKLVPTLASFGLAEKAPRSGCNMIFPGQSKSTQSRSIGLFTKTLTTRASCPRVGASCIAMGTTGKKCTQLRVIR